MQPENIGSISIALVVCQKQKAHRDGIIWWITSEINESIIYLTNLISIVCVNLCWYIMEGKIIKVNDKNAVMLEKIRFFVGELSGWFSWFQNISQSMYYYDNAYDICRLNHALVCWFTNYAD